MHPHRPKLGHLIAAEIREGILQGRWTDWLPQERALAEELFASRSVVRNALAMLKEEKLVESFQNKGNRIVKKAGRSFSRPDRIRTIGLLAPGSNEEIRPLVTLRIDDFRQELMKENCQIKLIESKSCFRKDPAGALATLCAHHSVDCWILRLSTRPMQQWFQDHMIPAVILGTCHEGITLPFVDIDRVALSRHAVRVLIKAGHRNFVLLISKDRNGGDLENERGFLEAVAEARKHYEGLQADIVYHGQSVEGVVLTVGKLLARAERPTAIFVSQPTFYLTVACDLARRGISIPKDISLITQSAGPYLSYMIPRPDSYYVNSQKFTRKLLAVVLAIINHDPVMPRNGGILPDYVRGDSLAHIGRDSSTGLTSLPVRSR